MRAGGLVTYLGLNRLGHLRTCRVTDVERIRFGGEDQYLVY